MSCLNLSGVRIGLVLWLCAAAGNVTAADDVSTRCKSIGNSDLSLLKDAPTQVTSAELITSQDGRPDYCEVAGYVAPSVGFLLRMPAQGWNEKFLELGCGGSCGTLSGAARSPGDFSGCIESMRRGYACLMMDGGHTGAGVLWAYNNLQAQIDLAFRAAHVASLAGKAIVELYYGRAPKKSYFWGCSTGGQQALMEAQRFPWDFDGIIAGCPTISSDGGGLAITWLWNSRALTDGAGNPVMNAAKMDLLHRAILAHCDGNDGVTDGVIGDPRDCRFDPARLSCKGGETSDCLTPQQIDAVRRVYRGPVNTSGEQVYFPGPMLGSEKHWQWLTSANYPASFFRYLSFDPSPGPTWQPADFDFDRDYKRIGVTEALFAAVNPDLRRFKAAGGKLLAYVGWNDAVGMPMPVVDYYETVERTMGGRAATQDFFRLFAVPGMGHCGGGEGPFAVDWLGALEAWVERDSAPEVLIGAHLKSAPPGDGGEASGSRFPLDPSRIEFTRPLYPYPVTTKYRGSGDPRDARNFGPSQRRDATSVPVRR